MPFASPGSDTPSHCFETPAARLDQVDMLGIYSTAPDNKHCEICLPQLSSSIDQYHAFAKIQEQVPDLSQGALLIWFGYEDCQCKKLARIQKQL